MSDTNGGFATATVTEDGNTFQVETNTGSAKEVQANLDAKPKPKDGPPADPKKEVREKISEAASELGKKGGEAAAKARKAAERADGDSDGPEGEEGEKKGVTRPSDDEEGIEDEDGKPKGNPRHDARARIQQLARERSEERRLRQELEARLARLEAERAPARAEQPPAKDPNARPAVDQFETYEEYVEALTDHARTLAQSGFAVLRYDPPGVGGSTGSLRFETLDDRAREAVAAVDYLRTRPEIRPDDVGVWGISQGGWVTQMAAAASENVAFMVSVSGSGVPSAEQQVYSVEAQSRAAGFPKLDIAKAGLFARLLVDWQLTRPLYRQQNLAQVRRLGPGPWSRFATLVYAPGSLTPAQSLKRGIAILKSITTDYWARYLYLDTAILRGAGDRGRHARNERSRPARGDDGVARASVSTPRRSADVGWSG